MPRAPILPRRPPRLATRLTLACGSHVNDSISPTPRRRTFFVGLLVALVLVVFDQWTKEAVYGWLSDGRAAELEFDVHGHRRYVVHGEWLSFMTSCNPGAAFGQLDQYPGLLVSGRVLAVLFLTYLMYQTRGSQRWVFSAMVLVFAGAVGNLIDNLWTGCGTDSMPFGVRDFVNVWFEPLFGWDHHFPSFNVADSCISVGAVIWVASGFFGGTPQPEARSEGDQGPSKADSAPPSPSTS